MCKHFFFVLAPLLHSTAEWCFAFSCVSENWSMHINFPDTEYTKSPIVDMLFCRVMSECENTGAKKKTPKNKLIEYNDWMNWPHHVLVFTHWFSSFATRLSCYFRFLLLLSFFHSILDKNFFTRHAITIWNCYVCMLLLG